MKNEKTHSKITTQEGKVWVVDNTCNCDTVYTYNSIDAVHTPSSDFNLDSTRVDLDHGRSSPTSD